MSYEFMFLARTSHDDPLTWALQVVANALGATVEDDENGVPQVLAQGLLINGVLPDDFDRETFRRDFDLDVDVTVVFEDVTHAGATPMVLAYRAMMRAVLGLAGHGASGVLLEEHYHPSATVLTFTEGRVVLAQDWDGWELWPEVLEVVPEPRRFANLRSRQGAD